MSILVYNVALVCGPFISLQHGVMESESAFTDTMANDAFLAGELQIVFLLLAKTYMNLL